MAKLYCNDCGLGFIVTDIAMQGYYGRCMDCIHEAGDCVGQDRHCYACAMRHNAGHRNESEKRYCQACHPSQTGAVPMFRGEA